MDNLRQLAICSIFNDKKDIDDYRVENAVNIICGKKFYVPEYSDTFSYLFKGMKKYYIDKVIGDNDNDNDDDEGIDLEKYFIKYNYTSKYKKIFYYYEGFYIVLAFKKELIDNMKFSPKLIYKSLILSDFEEYK